MIINIPEPTIMDINSALQNKHRNNYKRIQQSHFTTLALEYNQKYRAKQQSIV